MTTVIDDYLFIGGGQLSAREAAQRLGVSTRTIYRYNTALRGGPRRVLPPGPRYRELAWTWLLANPRQTAYEVTRSALGKRGPDLSSHTGSTRHLLLKMEQAGQVTRERAWRQLAGRDADLWSAVPGMDPSRCWRCGYLVEKCRWPGRCRPC